MIRPFLYTTVVGALLLCLSGCLVNGVVTDNSGVETTVKNISLSGTSTLTVLSGETLKNIPLQSINEISISAEDSRTIGGKLYFLGTVSLADGTNLDARDKNNKALTFVCVSDAIAGEAHKGRFSIGLSDVAKVKIVKK